MDIFTLFQSEGKTAVYYAGGTETITLCRIGSIHPHAVIDIKNIPECTAFFMSGQTLHLGAACTLTQIKDSNAFPLLGLACGRIADHTNQCRITLGGNLCGSIRYRETSLPLLVSDAEITLCGPGGERTVSFRRVFSGSMQRTPGEMVTQVHVPEWALYAEHAHIKKTANDKIDYPLVDVSAIRKGASLHIAFSGICSYPFRSEAIERVLNDRTLPLETRVEQAAGLLPEPAYGDAEGSGEYRVFVLKNTLRTLLEEWENGEI
jgi:CO/xanthine dehydrogenase FAD-binding subunit